MRSRDVLGKRVVRVDQERIHNVRTGERVQDLTRLVFDDGTALHFQTVELTSGYAVEGHVTRRAVELARRKP